MKYVLNDRIATDNPIIKYKLDSVKTWICLGNTAYPTLSNSNADFFVIGWNFQDVGYYNYYAPGDLENFTKAYFESRSSDGLYGIVDYLDENIFKTYDLFGFMVTGYEKVYFSFADATNPVYLVSFMLKK